MSVYKDKKRGTWYVSYSIKDEKTNKFLHKTKRGFESSRAAKEWEWQSRANSESKASNTFRDIAKIWEDHLQSTEIARRHHKEHFEYRFAEFLDRPIENITKSDLIRWRNWLSETKYATKTKNQTISYVKGVFRFAHAAFDLPDPSALLVNFKRSEDEILTENSIWTPEEFNKFIKYIEDPEYKVFFEFLFWTGCRRGEAIALQKCDVKEHSAIIKYSQRASVNGLHPTKTKQRRIVGIDEKLWSDLRPLLLLDGPYVFGGYVGLAPSTIDRVFKKAIKQSGVKNIRLHDLRHSHASWLINSGVNIVAVSKRLGHTNIEQTLRTYTHLLEFTDQNMMQKINDYRTGCEIKRETKYQILSNIPILHEVVCSEKNGLNKPNINHSSIARENRVRVPSIAPNSKKKPK